MGPVTLRDVADHQAAVAALFGPPATSRVAVADALGLVTAVDVAAPISLPGFDNSAMDGYAVRAADVASASKDSPVELPVVEDIAAGRTDALTLAPGTANRIMTGAPLPAGADAVVPVELTTSADGHFSTTAVSIVRAVDAGKHIRAAGSDIEQGAPALAAGTVLGAPQIGLLAALGSATIDVFTPLRVVVLSTGSELVTPGQPLQFGQIYESNGPMLTAAATAAGARARHEHFVVDDVAEFTTRIDAISDDADLIITSGGVSAGAFEVVKEALSQAGGVEFVKVAMQPGMPQGCGHVRSSSGRAVPIITLPGNPVSSLVSFEVFIRPALRAAMGLPPHRERQAATLASDVRSPDGKRQFMRGVLRADGASDSSGWAVDPIGPPGSHHLRYLAAADALIDIPADVTALGAGEVVDVWRLA